MVPQNRLSKEVNEWNNTSVHSKVTLTSYISNTGPVEDDQIYHDAVFNSRDNSSAALQPPDGIWNSCYQAATLTKK